MKQQGVPSAIAGAFTQIKRKIVTEKAKFHDPDSRVLASIREGNYEEFGELVKKYENFVYTLIYGMVRSSEGASDLTQEVFLRAYRSIRRFEQKSSFKTWLYRIAYNTSLAHISREKKIIEWEERSLAADNDLSYKNNNARLLLEKIISLLKPEYRAVIMLHYYDDLKYEEIAETLDCPVGTVKVRLYRAKHELKKLWSKYAVQL